MKWSSIAVLALCVYSCAGTGINFAPEAVNKLRVRMTTRDDVVQLLGKPESSRKILDGETKSTVEVYSFMRKSGLAETWNYKDLVLEYMSDTLNGFLYTNSFEPYSTDIDPNAIEKLKLHQTRRSEIIAILGQNYGEIVFPTNLVETKKSSSQSSDSTKSISSALSYRYRFLRNEGGNSSPVRYRNLLLYLNSEGVLVDRFYADNMTK